MTVYAYKNSLYTFTIALSKNLEIHFSYTGNNNSLAMSNIRKNSGWISIIGLSIFPALVWILMEPPGLRFGNFSSASRSFGQLTALVGMSMFSLSLILSARLKFLEKYFYGLNKIYDCHHIIGGMAFILLMAHPLFLAAQYIPLSLKAAGLFLIPGGDINIDFGILSLLALMILLIITFFAQNIKYEKWKLTHKFLGISFFLAGLHAFLIPSDISQNSILRAYILGLASIGIIAFIYRTVLGKFLVEKTPYKVIKTKIWNNNVFEIIMEPVWDKIDFKPGQFVFVSFENGEMSPEWHPFSITTSPAEKSLGLAIKILGDYTATLGKLKKGTKAEIEGPFGMFSHKNAEYKDQIWLAGGVGITPFLSMARGLVDENNGISENNNAYRIDLYYSATNKNEAVFLNELLEIEGKTKQLRIFPFYSEEQGFITASFIKGKSGDIENKDIFISAPPKMIEAMRNQFIASGVKNKNIHSEEFNFR